MKGYGDQPLLAVRDVSCPYCGEQVETTLDTPEPGLRYTEDCPVCCQPIAFEVMLEPDGGYRVVAAREND